MRKWLPLLLLLLPLAAFGQGIITIPTQQCVARVGDNPAWAATNLNEAGWVPVKVLMQKTQVLPPHFWLRCPADLTPLRDMAHPALQVANQYSAYQLFLNGTKIGSAGNMRTGAFRMDTIHQYPVPASLIGKTQDTVALRITGNYLDLPPAPSGGGLYAGESDALRGRRARQILAQSQAMLLPALGFFVVGIAGLMLLGLFYYDRSRRELLYLSIACIGLAALRADGFCTAANVNYAAYLAAAVESLANLALSVTFVLFFFKLARRRVPWFFWVAVAILSLLNAPTLVSPFLPLDSAYLLQRFYSHPWQAPVTFAAYLMYSLAPFVAFWPWRRITARMRPLAALSMVWGLVTFLWFVMEMLPYWQLGIPNYGMLWRGELLEIRAVVLISVLLTLLALLFRDQRRVTQERAALTGEMQAAQQIQRMLVPANVHTVPGVKLEVAFQPMREVGGDFYQCRILPDGAQRILLGDVSGKGAAAAMTAALIIGASKGRDAESPSALLHHLNQALKESDLAGFATCLCAHISPNGTLTVANAGHLAPYRNGEEIPLDSALPLGITESTEYTEKNVQLAPGDKLTFLSDGVLEARNPQGELYGFDRTREISTQSAEAIAQAASNFGQEDDITVLTLAYAGTGAAAT